MSNLTFALVWCAIQVTAVSLLALLIIQVFMKRRPEVAAATAAWTLGVALLATMAIPFQLPDWMLRGTRTEIGLETTVSVNLEAVPSSARSEFEPPPETRKFEIQFELASLVRDTIDRNLSRPINAWQIGEIVLVGLSLGLFLALVRFAVGIISLRTLCRRATVIQNAELEHLAQSLTLNPQRLRLTTFAQSPDIDCAAVVGFRRPIILLSSHWRSWSQEELRAVLAHELAHLHRGDTWWRMIATLCSAIHFYNPLVHWITNRLVLAQELATDQMAIQITGEARTYLRALAQLAIQHSGGRCGPSPLFLTPVFTGHFMRRIEMLQAMDCQQIRSAKRWLTSSVIISIIMFGMTTTLVRCVAQTRAADHANENANQDTPAPSLNATSSDSGTSPKFFVREKLPATHPALSQSGGLHLNLAALKESPIWSIFEKLLLDEMLNEEWTKGWDLKLLDSISTDLNVSITPVPEKDQRQERKSFAVGFTNILLKVNRDVDWKTAIQFYYPQCVTGISNEVEVQKLTLPEIGPLPLQMSPVTLRELAIWITAPSLKPEIDPRKWHGDDEVAPKPEWSDEWNAVGGGVATLFLHTKTRFPVFSDFENQADHEKLNVLGQGIDLVALGIDISPDASRLEARLRLRCHESFDPKIGEAAVLELLQSWNSKLGKESAPSDLKLLTRLTNETIESATTRVIAGSPNVIECHFRVHFPQELFQILNANPTLKQPVPLVPQGGAKPGSTKFR